MRRTKSLRLFLLPLLIIVIGLITGCSSSYELSEEGTKENLKKVGSGDVNAYTNSSELVVTNTSPTETELIQGNLESLTSSLAGTLASSELNYDGLCDELMKAIIEFINTPYLYGGSSKSGIDCSAFVQTVMYQAFGLVLPRTSLEQSMVGEDVNVEDLRFGDLVFFDTMNKNRVSHVGIYLGDGYFAHSGSRTGVAIANLNSDYYSRTFIKAKRVLF